MKKLAICLLLIALSGCAILEEQNQLSATQIYSNQYKPLVDNGEMTWSEYYKGLYNTVENDNSPIRGEFLIILNDLIDSALSYENKNINKEQFESSRRKAKANVDIINSRYEMRMQELEASRPPPAVYQTTVKEADPLENWPMLKSPKNTRCTTYGNVTDCQTN